MTYGVGDEVVDEPRKRNAEQLFPVALDNEPVWGRSTSDGALLVVAGLLNVPTPEEDGNGRDGTKTKRKPPHETQVVLTTTTHSQPAIKSIQESSSHPEEYQWDEGGDDETEVNHGV